jgi:hypothetical protein
MAVKLSWHCFLLKEAFFIMLKISYKIISNTLANVEFASSYGQKQPVFFGHNSVNIQL